MQQAPAIPEHGCAQLQSLEWRLEGLFPALCNCLESHLSAHSGLGSAALVKTTDP
ncbi:MAG TPA: hypothetical protein VFB27_01330 [Opitutaceae bacterium]|nr:hypothetical protein [Opitutaceae bacterium]